MSAYGNAVKKIKALSTDIEVTEERGCIVLRGEADKWSTAVKAGQLVVNKKKYLGVINDIKLRGFVEQQSLPSENDRSLEGAHPDVLIIGGGIVGCAIARELARWKLDILLVEKGPDVAVGASRANGGVIHVGVNFPRTSQKHFYNLRGNGMYAELSRQMGVPFEQKGQTMLCARSWEKIPVRLLQLHAKMLGIPGVRYLEREELKQHEPRLPDFAIGGMYMPIGGITNPYEMTVALAENAVENGVSIRLNTAVLGMKTENGHIASVGTNRGHIRPRLVINAAGVYADTIADMAGDRTFTIHPRRGTDIITDKKAGFIVQSSMAKSPFSMLPSQSAQMPKGLIAKIKFFINTLAGSSHTKGVGLIHSIHGNMLIGPNAVETPDREDTATHRDEVEAIIKQQQYIARELQFSDVIAYFTGVRAPTYEEDFVVRRGIFTDNIIEAAGIQSPGVTAAPAIAQDIAGWAVEFCSKTAAVERNGGFNPERRSRPRLAGMGKEARHALILKNPNYGVIICRCEEISKGEIMDALDSPLCVPTLDGIKRRLRPGMGRCQGGFCAPLVMQIIAEHQGIPITKVMKNSPESLILFGGTKVVEQ